MNKYVIILAGGSGTRLWPLSRKSKPKQFLIMPPASRSLLQETIYRALELVPPQNIFVVGSKEHKALLFSQIIPISPKISIMLEPCARNTLPAIMWACSRIQELSKSCGAPTIVTVMPADHHIGDKHHFIDMCVRAQKLAKDHFVLFGVKPTYPSTDYGYVKIGDRKRNYFPVKQFVEKPDETTAKKYIRNGNYVWNAGVFTFNLLDLWITLNSTGNEDYYKFKDISEQNYSSLKSVSFDIGVLEKINPDWIRLISLRKGWSDLGTWKSRHAQYLFDPEFREMRDQGVVTDYESISSMVWNHTNKLVVTVGVNNLIVVQEDDVTLICDKDKAHLLPIVTNQISDGLLEYSNVVDRPWGSYRVLHEANGYKVKEITVMPGQMLSLQSHKFRAETWTVVAGKAEVFIESKHVTLEIGTSIEINIGNKHRLANPFKETLKIIEVQIGLHLGEDDIIRYDDMYGRVK